jgi:hypothetical protein
MTYITYHVAFILDNGPMATYPSAVPGTKFNDVLHLVENMQNDPSIPIDYFFVLKCEQASPTEPDYNRRWFGYDEREPEVVWRPVEAPFLWGRLLDPKSELGKVT